MYSVSTVPHPAGAKLWWRPWVLSAELLNRLVNLAPLIKHEAVVGATLHFGMALFGPVRCT